jgi:hypothetical protein
VEYICIGTSDGDNIRAELPNATETQTAITSARIAIFMLAVWENDFIRQEKTKTK